RVKGACSLAGFVGGAPRFGLSGHGRIISAPTVDESCAYAMAGDGLSLAGAELISTHVFF
ncbi:MAG: hypothetical protein RSC25_07910, partial [Christensenella sp.]